MKPAEAYRTLYGRSPIPLVTVREDGRIADANAAFCEAARMSHGELVGTAFVDQLMAQDRGASRVYLRQSLDQGVAEWPVSLVGSPAVRWTLRSVAFLERVAVMMLWTPPVHDVPRALVPALAALAKRVPGQAVVLLSEDLWVLGSWGMAAVGGRDDAEALGRHLSKLIVFEGLGLDGLSSALASEMPWSGAFELLLDYEDPSLCVGDLIPARVVGGSRQGAGFLVIRPSTETGAAGGEGQRVRRLARVGDFTVHLVEGLRDRVRQLASADSGGAAHARFRLEMESLEQRLKHFTEGVRSEGVTRLGTLIESVRGRWEPFLQDQGIALSLPVVDETEVPVALPEEVATAVLDELIENARVAVAETDDPRILVDVGIDESTITLRVEDSGPGVPRAHRDALFEPFYSRWDGRLGLGLSVARAQVDLRGGRLEVSESELGGGAFAVTVPRTVDRADPPEAARADAQRRPRLAGRSVLLLEDSEDMRRALSRILETAGMEVREAWSGRSALSDLVQRGATDLAVCCFTSDEAGALRFVSDLREADAGLARRTVVVTDAASVDQRREQESRLECPVLARPIVVERLLERLEAIVSRG